MTQFNSANKLCSAHSLASNNNRYTLMVPIKYVPTTGKLQKHTRNSNQSKCTIRKRIPNSEKVNYKY